MTKFKSWKTAEAKKPVSQSPRIDAFMEGKILMPGQFAYELSVLAKSIEAEAIKCQNRCKNLELIAKTAQHDKKIVISNTYKKEFKKDAIPSNPYETLSNYEVMSKLRGFGFGWDTPSP